jgi:ribonuclease Z
MPLPITVIFLGTAGSTPTKERNLPCVALEYDGNTFLFDCGEGTQRQLMVHSVNPHKIKAIFITHMHGDHVIGVAGLVRTLALNKRSEKLEIYVPEGEQSKLKPLIELDKAIRGYEISIIPVKSGSILKGKGFTINAFKLNHSIPTYGYAFIENDKHHFIKEKCVKLGIKGTMYSKLQKAGKIKIGKKNVLLKDVTTLENGRKIVYVADTRPTQNTITISKNATLLIHEATYTSEFIELAKQRFHSTSMESAKIAKTAKVKNLIIFHMSARYKDESLILKEAKKVFSNTKVAYDGMKITF